MGLNRILLHLAAGSRVVKRAIDPGEVYFLEAEGGDTLVRLRGARRLRDVRPFSVVAPFFEPFHFLRIHRSYAVNLRRIRELRPRADGEDPPPKSLGLLVGAPRSWGTSIRLGWDARVPHGGVGPRTARLTCAAPHCRCPHGTVESIPRLPSFCQIRQPTRDSL